MKRRMTPTVLFGRNYHWFTNQRGNLELAPCFRIKRGTGSVECVGCAA